MQDERAGAEPTFPTLEVAGIVFLRRGVPPTQREVETDSNACVIIGFAPGFCFEGDVCYHDVLLNRLAHVIDGEGGD